MSSSRSLDPSKRNFSHHSPLSCPPWAHRVLLCALLCFSWSCTTSAPIKTSTPSNPNPSSTKVDTEVAIIGAGLSGLATAYELKKAGISFEIYELTPRWGGRVRTVTYEYKGETLTADSGMEEYWESNPAISFLKEFGLGLHTDYATSSMRLMGKLIPLETPDGVDFYERAFSSKERAELSRFKTLAEKAFEDLPRLSAKQRQSLIGISFRDWVVQNTNTEKVREWIRISMECEAGTSWTQLSALDGLAEMHIFVSHEGRGERSVRVTQGNEAFTDAFAKAVGPQQIHTNTRVTALRREGETTVVSLLDLQSHQHREIRARHVISTIPLFRLMEIQFSPPLTEEHQRAIATQTWGSYFKAHVFVSSNHNAFWSGNGLSLLPLLSDSPLGVIYDGNPESQTKTKILSLLVTGHNAEAFNMMPLTAVEQTLRREFDALWPGFSTKIEKMELYRFHPRAIAGWPVGRSRFDGLSETLRRPFHGVHFAGDFTESSHSDGAFTSAHRAVSQILESRGHR